MNIMVDKFHVSLVAVAMAVGLTIGSGLATADENWSDHISFSGFANANYHITNDSAPFNGVSGQGHDDKGSFAGTNAGLNFRADISERFNFTAQFFGVEEDNDFNAHFELAFATLKVTDDVDFRAGKTKLPAGLVNEYVNVGYALPWINAPAVIYSELALPGGPQVTRQAYTGVALVGNRNTGEWTFGGNLFGGEVDLDSGKLRQLYGLTLNADWNDLVQFQATYYTGEMNGITTMPAMNGQDNEAWLIGAKADWNNVVVYAEKARVEMGNISAADRDSWYTTVGYRFGKLLPFVNYESYERGNTDEQTTATLGVRWDFMPSVALKAEVARIDTDKGLGLFAAGTPSDEVMMYGLGLSTVF
ncbi:MAG: hypothetical protein BMS9Abin08_1230 [Gammaproteobacteria bacterium]|nr:MAG: hypothetical protein BMS9Abin08_1230 [Gammaproteobacteria bacterium]